MTAAVSRPLRILISGGVRTGKSAFALERACALGARRAYIATAEALDEEMRDRVVRHRRERGRSFATVEEPIDLQGALDHLADSGATDVAVVDCLTLWISNQLVRGDAEDAIVERVDDLARWISRAPLHVVFVSNEVGFGVVPDSALGRAFRDLVGTAHQRLAPLCDELYLGALGMILRLRPAPVALVERASEAGRGGDR